MTASEDPAVLAEELRPVITALTLMLRRETSQLPLSASQATVLAMLAEEGPARISTLAAALRVTQPSTTSLVNRMEQAGWVRRSADPSDQRAVQVSLTPAGRRMLAKARAARAAVLAARLAALTPAQRRAVAAAIPALSLLADVRNHA